MDQLEAAINASMTRCQGGRVEPKLDFKTNLDFQPFNKTSERSNVYAISDWSIRTRGRQQQQSGIAGGFAFKNDEELSAFNETRQQKRTFLKPSTQKVQPGQSRLGRKIITSRSQPRRAPQQSGPNSKFNPNQRNRFNNFRRDEPARAYSCQLPSHWENIARFSLTTPSGSANPQTSTLKQVGIVDPIADMNFRQARPLQIAEQRSVAEVAIENDPYISEILRDSENIGADGTFIMTAQVASLLMSTHRTVQPWDLQVNVAANNVTFVTTGSNPNNIVNLHLVDETSLDKLPAEIDNINSVISLAQEATTTQNIARNMIIARGPKPLSLGPPCPVAPEANGAPPSITAYTYRRFELEDKVLIVRAPIHAHDANNQDNFIHIASIFEFDSSFGGYHVDWKKNLNTMYASVLSNELKTNLAYMHRVASEAILSGASAIKLMWISRQSPKSTQNHTLLAVTEHDVSAYIQLVQARRVDYFDGLWNILNEISLEAGQYTLLREPNERTLSIYEQKAAPTETEEQA